MENKIVALLQIPVKLYSSDLAKFEQTFPEVFKYPNQVVRDLNDHRRPEHINKENKWLIIIFIQKKDYKKFKNFIQGFPKVGIPFLYSKKNK